ncbi:MAG: hypothetical protein ACPLYC_00255 [Minisyncoccia bacterium]
MKRREVKKMRQLKKIKVTLGALGLLFDCPYCKMRLYVPSEDITDSDKNLNEKLVKCENCRKKFIVIIQDEERRETNG